MVANITKPFLSSSLYGSFITLAPLDFATLKVFSQLSTVNAISFTPSPCLVMWSECSFPNSESLFKALTKANETFPFLTM